MNINTVASAEENKISLEDVISLLEKENGEEELSNLSDEGLNSLLNKSIEQEEFEIAAKIRDILKEKKNIKLDEGNGEEDAEKAKEQKKNAEKAKKQKKNAEEQIKKLKGLLNDEDPIEEAEESVEEVEESVEEVEESVEEVEESVEEVEDPIEEVEDPIEEVEDPIEEVEDPIEEVEDPIEEVEDPIEEIEDLIKEEAEDPIEEVEESVEENEEAEKLKKKIKDLQRKLEKSKKNNKEYEKRINNLEKREKSLRERNSEILKQIKKAKNSGDKKTIQKLQGVIEKLALEKKALRDKYAGELPKYDSQEIAKLKTRWIGFKLAGKINIDGQTMLTGPQLLFRRNIRSRNIMNKTVKALNKIGNDPKKGVKYIMTKSSLVEGGKIRAGMKNLNQFFKVRDVNTFDKIFSEQKQKFINDLESKMDKNSMSDADKKTISAIKTRLDYYHKAYKRQFIVV